MISSNERSIKTHRNVKLSSKSKQTSNVSSTSLNRKVKSSQALETSRSKSVSTSKSESFFPSYDIDGLSSRQMHESLIRLRKNAIQPFTFLNNIFDEKTSDQHFAVEKIKPTEIDLKLAALTRRVQLNKSLLERTNERVKEINFLIKRNALTATRELNHGDEGSKDIRGSGDELSDKESALNIACPGIVELKRTINMTKEMLRCVKKICNNEIGMSDLPEELKRHMSSCQTLTHAKDVDS